jgi:hypothetical protein
MALRQENPSCTVFDSLAPNFFEERDRFSLVPGGPLFRVFPRSRLAGDPLELLHRRLVVITLVPWLPLLLTIVSPEELITRMIKVVF